MRQQDLADYPRSQINLFGTGIEPVFLSLPCGDCIMLYEISFLYYILLVFIPIITLTAYFASYFSKLFAR